jgi:hypothetical protein
MTPPLDLRGVQLATPVPPAKTGTAIYVKHFLQHYAEGSDPTTITILVDSEQYEMGVPHTCCGATVLDYRELDPYRPVWLFLANNSWHRYCHRMLACCDPSQTTAVIHEPCCAMLVKELCDAHYFPYSPVLWNEILSLDLTNDVARRAAAHGLPLFPQYNTVGLHPRLRALKTIYVHSRFAKAKLMIDRGIPARNIVTIPHPPNSAKDIGNAESTGRVTPMSDDTIRFGTFGWVQSSKRTREIVVAYDRFLGTLDIAKRSKCRFYIVGEICDPDKYHPRLWDLEYARIGRELVLIGYAPDDQFDILVASMHCIFALRYPSCGETSGAFHKAKDVGATLVGNDYNAFAESTFDMTVSTDPLLEADELFDVFQTVATRFWSEQP